MKAFKGGDIENELRKFAKGKGKYILTATEEFQPAEERKGESHSVFTQYLLKGLLGEADLNNDGIVTITELCQYVSNLHDKQQPTITVIGARGEFSIVKIPPSPPPDSPYLLDHKDLSLMEFPEVLAETRDDDGRIDIAFVIGSGRYLIADHTSFGTDALFIPEICALLKDKVPDIHFSSYLDIDIYNTADLGNKNLILIGSGKVNLVTLKLQERFGENLKVKFTFSSAGEIFSYCQTPPTNYSVEEYPDWNSGILSLTKNPWAADLGKRKIVILVAGAHPIGTISAMKKILQYIEDANLRINNKHDQKVPAKIVRGIPVGYDEYRKKNPFVTKMAGRTKSYIGNIKGCEEVE